MNITIVETTDGDYVGGLIDPPVTASSTSSSHSTIVFQMKQFDFTNSQTSHYSFLSLMRYKNTLGHGKKESSSRQ